MSDRPDFQLESYDALPLEHNKMLRNNEDLIGQTIKACVSYPCGNFCARSSMVLVTETGCWAVVTVSGFSLEDASCELMQRHQTGGHRSDSPLRDLTIHDFLSADELLSEGLVGSAEHAMLREKELATGRVENLAEAERLRKRLAELEGGAE